MGRSAAGRDSVEVTIATCGGGDGFGARILCGHKCGDCGCVRGEPGVAGDMNFYAKAIAQVDVVFEVRITAAVRERIAAYLQVYDVVVRKSGVPPVLLVPALSSKALLPNAPGCSARFPVTVALNVPLLGPSAEPTFK